ncbi:hypothetical protein CSKR_108587, partial [Clonorchis sinensis]
CTSCLELQAELVTTEVLASTQLKEHTRISDAQIATLELELHNLRERLEQDQPRPFTLDSCIQTEPSVIDGGREHLAVRATETSVPPFPLVPPEGVVRQAIDYQTEPPDSASTESDGRASVMLKRYSKLSADAACICLALAQRIASMNQRGVPDGEHSPDTNDDFNTLLNALSSEEQEDFDVDTDSYRSGYKILACSLARLNHEVERLASIVDTREYGRYGPAYENGPTTNGEYSQDREHEVVELRTRLSAALQLLSERLPADTQKALIATSQIVESERIQLQAELERRMIMFEQSHTSSVAELESSRRALMEQLATAEAENVQLKDQLSVTQQKLQANDRFIAEQTEERENEREEFRTELARLETQLRKTKGELLAAKLVNGASVTTEDPADSVSHNKSLWLEDSIEATEPKHQDSTHRPQSAPRYTMVSRLEQGNSLLGNFNCMCRRASDVTHSRSWALSPRMTNNNGVFDFHSLSPDSLVCTPMAAGDRLCHCTLGDVRSPTWPDDNGTIPTSMAHQESSDHTAVSLVAASSSFCQTEPEEESTENQEVVKTAVALLYLNDASSQTDVELVPLEELLQAQTRIRQLEENNVSLSPLLPNLDTHRRPSWVAEADDDSATGIDCVSCVFMDSSTQTLDAEIDENSPELVTKTRRIVRTRTWDAAAAAAFLGQLTLTEEEQEIVSSIVKREHCRTQRNSFSNQEPLQIELKDQAVNTEAWDVIDSPQPGSGHKPKRRHSLPSLLSLMDDTGVEMSRGMTVFDSVDLDLLRMSGVDVASPKSRCLPPHVDSIRSDIQIAEENMDTTLIHQVSEEESPLLASVTLLDRAQSPIEVLVDVQSPPIIAPSLSVTDASCDTQELEMEITPASDLKALLEQKAASDLVLSAMREEITSLQTHHTELQTDYNFLQEMLEERECELERFAQDSIVLQTRLSAVERELKERKDVVLERDEDMFILTEANESLTARVRELEELVMLSKLSTRSVLETGVQPDEDLLGDRTKSPGPQMIEKEIDATRWNAVELYVQTDPDPVMEGLTTRVKELETSLEASQSRLVESVEAGLQTDPDAVVENLTAKVKALEARRFEVVPSADVNVQTDTGALLIPEKENRDISQSDIQYVAEQSVQTDVDQLAESLSARLKCLEEDLDIRTRPCMVDCQVQTENAVATGDPSVSPTAALPAPPNVVQVEEESDQWDTIVEETSTLHGFNDFGEAELAELPQTEHVPPCVDPSGIILATSTPDQLSEVTDAISCPVPQIHREDIPVELKTVVQRLRAESLRLFSLSTGFQHTDVSQRPTENGEQPQEAMQHQFSVFSDLVRANTSLKNALSQISQMVEVYEIPTSGSSPYQLTGQKTFSYEDIQKLVRCTANALAADEAVWLGLLQLSFEQTAELVSAVSKPPETEYDGKVVPAQRLVWKAITRLGDQLSSFIRQEDQYRECLVQAHLVEQRYLSAELHTSTTRGDSLASEIDRLTERLNTHKEALSRADSLNLRLVNQVNSLKADLATANSDLQAEVIQSEQKQAKLDRLNTQLIEEQQKSSAFRIQIENLKSDTDRLEQELRDAKQSLVEANHAVTVAEKRVENVEQAADQSRIQSKSANSASLSPEHSSGLDVTPGQSAISSQEASSISPKDLFNAISRTATNLAVARHTANKAERRARELEVTNKELRLCLAETELRLMPLLVAFTQSPLPSCPVSNADNARSTTRPLTGVRELYSQLPPSSRFAELKDVCTRLLSIASTEDQEEDERYGNGRNQSPDHSSDDEDEVTPDNPPIASKVVSFDPKVSICYSLSGSEAHLSPQTPVSRIRVGAERDENQLVGLPKDPLLRIKHVTGSFLTNGTAQPTSLNVPAVPLENGTPNRFSCVTTPEQTVSLERFRNIHARYLRSESYRRALTFQKRYLLLLLGGFQYPEEAVVASLGRPDFSVYSDQASLAATDSGDGFSPPTVSAPLRRFRAAARTAQVIYRMRHMMNRWRRSGLHSSATVRPSTGDSSSTVQKLTPAQSTTAGPAVNGTSRLENSFSGTPQYFTGPMHSSSVTRFPQRYLNSANTVIPTTTLCLNMPTLTTGSTRTIPSILPSSHYSDVGFRSSTTQTRPSSTRPSQAQPLSHSVTTGQTRGSYSTTALHPQPNFTKSSPSPLTTTRPRPSTEHRGTGKLTSARSSTGSSLGPSVDTRFRSQRFSFR